ncbi:MAG TPA: DegT/DnrJ/EryC1/StrS family aminotransferase [Geminicoccus sp.]|uniref:DegT/DnrJ/EryC1/StrS family aminotransferase n=1 Tax=Geminicoccus sp. TaxID=2024832 RepID=UPI002D06C44C|nr:DegT/DnrJ/EryC1/StrS family aminotransferase [Geminicoccus sp.]HWL71478.1 DegT/DnrJ/EryC1/StrS family aminotransferase [Geminicoccus sp.]
MIPLVDLQAQHRALLPQLEAAASRILASGHFVLGDEVEAFEAEFAAFCGTRHAVAVSTGTAALHLALLAAGIGPGDEVITTTSTFVASVAAILYAGATPVLVDLDPVRLTLDPAQVAAAVTPRTRAILPVHLHGGMADMDRIEAVARRHGLAVIEDACQAHGAEHEGRRAGSIGDIGCFSFYPGKNLGACGEGGAVVTNDAAVAAKVRQLRDWGQSARYVHELQGFNYRLDAIQAAFLRVKLPHLESWTAARRRHALRYDAGCAQLDVAGPPQMPGVRHVYHVYAIRCDGRDAVRQHLGEAGIATGIHYPTPVHLQPAYAGLGYRLGDFPHAERYARQTLSLPMFPELDDVRIRQVLAGLAEALAPVPGALE